MPPSVTSRDNLRDYMTLSHDRGVSPVGGGGSPRRHVHDSTHRARPKNLRVVVVVIIVLLQVALDAPVGRHLGFLVVRHRQREALLHLLRVAVHDSRGLRSH